MIRQSRPTRGDGPIKKRRDKKGPGKLMFRRSRCKFCMAKIKQIDYLDYQSLRKFTTERGKILPSRITSACAKHQRQLSKAIKRARHIGLMPYVAE